MSQLLHECDARLVMLVRRAHMGRDELARKLGEN